MTIPTCPIYTKCNLIRRSHTFMVTLWHVSCCADVWLCSGCCFRCWYSVVVTCHVMTCQSVFLSLRKVLQIWKCHGWKIPNRMSHSSWSQKEILDVKSSGYKLREFFGSAPWKNTRSACLTRTILQKCITSLANAIIVSFNSVGFFTTEYHRSRCCASLNTEQSCLERRFNFIHSGVLVRLPIKTKSQLDEPEPVLLLPLIIFLSFLSIPSLKASLSRLFSGLFSLWWRLDKV